MTINLREIMAKSIYKTDSDDGWEWETEVQANRDICLAKADAALTKATAKPEVE